MSSFHPLHEKVVMIQGRRFRLKVETSSNAADYAVYDALRESVWGFPEDHLAGARNMMCENYLHEGSSLFIGAYAEERTDPVGFTYGFVGVRDKTIAFHLLDNLWFYAQYAGVLPDYQGYGLGIRIKEFQGEVVRDVLGVNEMVCTYDPLTGVNAFRNIHHFGMRVLDYRAATYGEYGGHLNRTDIPTDRFFMSWDLRAGTPRRVRDSVKAGDEASEVLAVEWDIVPGRSGPLEIERVRRVDFSGETAFKFVAIPADFYLMIRETDVSNPEVRRIPLEWRLATRQAFQDLLARGYQIVDFVKGTGLRMSNAYLLHREPKE